MEKVLSKEFKSMDEFYKYISETPLNDSFRWAILGSTGNDYSYYKTYNFEEASGMLKKGWDDMAQTLDKKLKLAASSFEAKTVVKSSYDVCGYQASVPRYLQGIPTSMVNQKKVVQKQKVITLVKHIGYMGGTSAEEIIENSVKALAIVKKLEAQGYRVNLDVISPARSLDQDIICRIRIKSADERMNIAKVAFPLVHPSMLRRLVFRFREVIPGASKRFVGGYGSTIMVRKEVKALLNKGEYYLHNFLGDIDKEIADMQVK